MAFSFVEAVEYLTWRWGVDPARHDLCETLLTDNVRFCEDLAGAFSLPISKPTQSRLSEKKVDRTMSHLKLNGLTAI